MYNSLAITGFEFNGKVYTEHLPKVDQAQGKQAQRAVFFSLFNFDMPKCLRFKESEINREKSLYENFLDKITSMLPVSFIAPYQKPLSIKVDAISTSIIHSFSHYFTAQKAKYLFKNQKELSYTLFAKKPKLSIAKLINVIYKAGRCFLSIDLEGAFSNLVCERIKQANKDKKVTFTHDGISIEDENQSTFVVTNFKNLDLENLYKYQEIQIAKDKITNNTHQLVYIIYPKSADFHKHIEVKIPEINKNEDEYRVKLIPYSFSFCLKNTKGRKQCNK